MIGKTIEGGMCVLAKQGTNLFLINPNPNAVDNEVSYKRNCLDLAVNRRHVDDATPPSAHQSGHLGTCAVKQDDQL